MSIHRKIAATLVAALVAASPCAAQYYYSGGGTIPLQVDSSRIVVKCDAGFGPQQQAALLSTISRIQSFSADDHMLDGFVSCEISTGQGYEEYVDSVQAVDGIYLAEPYYLNEMDSAFPVGLTFCVAFDEDLTESDIESINALFGVVIDHQIEGMSNVYVLRNTDSSGYHLVDLANTYYELPETRYAHPEFGFWIQKQTYRLFDYFRSEQPHTKKVIGQFNEASVWDFAGLGTDRDTVVVAVLDDGIDAHEDLPAGRILPGMDYSVNDNDPRPGPDVGHGMACAGIIGASHTLDSVAGLSSSTGTISLNPSVMIRPVKIFNDSGFATGVTAADLAAAITYAYASGAEVLSNSWAYNTTCTPVGGLFDVLNEAIANAATLGRGGLGCPVIFSAGNYNDYFYGVAYPGCLPSAFAVGATTLDDYRWGYSSYGNALDIVAPSGNVCLQGDVWSLDQMAGLGYNPRVTSMCGDPVSWYCMAQGQSGGGGVPNDTDYDCHFGGTSAACPVVAGTAALLLAKDSTLSAQAVYYILRKSAERNLEWGVVDTPSTQYGYGRVDAFRAVLSISRDGDVNGLDGGPDIADLVYLVNYMFRDGPAPFPSELLGDLDCSGDLDVADALYLVNYMFKSGPAFPYPCFEY